MLETIGGTPLVKLQRVVPAGAAEVWLKIEGGNPTGSYKDRMALAMVEGAERAGHLDDGKRLLEVTGGSTGTSLAFVCALKQIPLTLISSDAYAREKLDAMRAFGAELLIDESEDGLVNPKLWPRMLATAERMVEAGTHHWLRQFENPDNAAGYTGMGEELIDQAPRAVDAFCGAVGTGGMLHGVGRVVRDRFPDARVVAVEPASSAVISGGPPGSHGVDGTAAGFVPPVFDRELIRECLPIEEAEARAMARRLAREEGIFAGTSTGLNVVAALKLAEEIGAGGLVVSVACDTGYKYLDGELYRAG